MSDVRLSRVAHHYAPFCKTLGYGMTKVGREDYMTAPLVRVASATVIERIAKEYFLSKAQLIGRNKQRRYAWPRLHLYAALRRECPHLSTTQIGRIVGRRDHSTVISGIRKFDALNERGLIKDFRAALIEEAWRTGVA